MSWEDQGRQQHGWFGSGKGTNGPSGQGSDDAATTSQTLKQRQTSVVYAAVAAMPRDLRVRAATLLNPGTSERLTALMTAWSGDRTSNRAQFAARFFGREAGDPVVTALLAVAVTAKISESPDALRDAAGHLADAMQSVGLDHWPGFLADAEARAQAAADADAKAAEQVRTGFQEGVSIRPVGSGAAVRSPGSSQVAQLIIPSVAIPPPPSTMASQDEAADRAAEKQIARGLHAIGEAIGNILHSDGGETRSKPPAGSKPINQTPWSGDHDEIKSGIRAKGKDNVRISSNGDVWGENQDGSWTNHGSAGNYTGSGQPSGQKGKDRDRRG